MFLPKRPPLHCILLALTGTLCAAQIQAMGFATESTSTTISGEPTQELPASFGQRQPLTYNLRTLLESALTTHPLLQGARFEARAAGQDVLATERQRWPTLSIVAETNSAQSSTSTATNLLRIDQTVWDGGRNTALITEAQIKVNLAKVQIHVQKQDLFIQIINAWQNLVAAKERLHVADLTLAQLEGYRQQMNRRIKAKASPAIDLELAHARVLQTQVERTTAKTAIQTAITRLEQLSGIVNLGQAQPHPSASESISGIELFLKELNQIDWQVVASDLPIVAKARLDRQLVESQLRTKQASQLPQFYVRYDKPLTSASSTANTQGSWFAGFRYSPGAGFAGHVEAQAISTRIQGQDQAIENAIREGLNSLQNDREELINAHNRIESLGLAVNGSKQVLGSYLRQFQAGRKSWQDLLNAAREMAQNQYSLADAQASLVGAMYRLQLRMGSNPDFP